MATGILTKADLVLKAASDLLQPFSLNELAEKCFIDYPEDFGFAGLHGSYPDKNLVVTYVVGKRGLVATGRLHRVDRGLYRVPVAGDDHA